MRKQPLFQLRYLCLFALIILISGCARSGYPTYYSDQYNRFNQPSVEYSQQSAYQQVYSTSPPSPYHGYGQMMPQHPPISWMALSEWGQNNYHLKAADRINISVEGEKTLTKTYEIDQSGYFSMPVIGRVHALGKTPEAIRIQITNKLSENYLKNPDVAVTLAHYRPLNLEGEISKPRQVTYRLGMNVKQALSEKHGFKGYAEEEVVLIRRYMNGFFGLQYVTTDFKPHPGDAIIILSRYDSPDYQDVWYQMQRLRNNQNLTSGDIDYQQNYNTQYYYNQSIPQYSQQMRGQQNYYGQPYPNQPYYQGQYIHQPYPMITGGAPMQYYPSQSVMDDLRANR